MMKTLIEVIILAVITNIKTIHTSQQHSITIYIYIYRERERLLSFDSGNEYKNNSFNSTTFHYNNIIYIYIYVSKLGK